MRAHRARNTLARARRKGGRLLGGPLRRRWPRLGQTRAAVDMGFASIVIHGAYGCLCAQVPPWRTIMLLIHDRGGPLRRTRGLSQLLGKNLGKDCVLAKILAQRDRPFTAHGRRKNQCDSWSIDGSKGGVALAAPPTPYWQHPAPQGVSAGR